MGTRGCIARLKSREPLEYTGVYHHWNGYPAGLGRRLFRLRNGLFGGNTEVMLEVLIDAAPNGWESIMDDPKREDIRMLGFDGRCTHDRGDYEFAYVFTEATMLIVRYGGEIVDEVDLTGPEPDWPAITRKAGDRWADWEPSDVYDRDDWNSWWEYERSPSPSSKGRECWIGWRDPSASTG